MNENIPGRIKLPDGTDLPRIGQGTWCMGDDASRRSEEIAALRHGVELGLSVIDTAEMYGDGRSEELVGEAIRGSVTAYFWSPRCIRKTQARISWPAAVRIV